MIGLNSDFMIGGRFKDYPYLADHSYWVGVMVHELLHNLGYDHGSGHDTVTDYRKYFMVEFANALWYSMDGKLYSSNEYWDNQTKLALAGDPWVQLR